MGAVRADDLAGRCHGLNAGRLATFQRPVRDAAGGAAGTARARAELRLPLAELAGWLRTHLHHARLEVIHEGVQVQDAAAGRLFASCARRSVAVRKRHVDGRCGDRAVKRIHSVQ